jgi:4-amino-4-deoxy-L-arabinose transferase-like glycosyltransferase
MARPSRFIPLLVFAGLLAAIFWLRWPSFGRLVWNLDEGIHATIARTILDGGVMYRDAIDQRTPLSYYLVAVIFAFSGVNNLWAVHAVVAGMISATALGVFLLGRRWHGTAAGVWAAVVFAAFSCNLLYVGDAYGVTTEWFVILFTTWGAWRFCTTWPEAGFWPAFGAGLAYAAAFLCKQPALLDFGAPLALVIYLAATRQLQPREAARVLTGLIAGFTALTALVFAYFWWRGALADFYFYAWTYNLVYYGPETSVADRFQSAMALAGIIRTEYPLLLGVIGAAIAALLFLLAQKHPSAEEKAARAPAVFLLFWLVLAVAGSASAGRVYGHYYIQALPALALAAAWVLGAATRRSLQAGNGAFRLATALLVIAAGWNVVAHSIKGRARPGLGAEGAPTADFVKAHSLPSDRIFVWGYCPDYYLFADRPPASRYIYCSFQTGLLPWTNIAPGLDTSYAIVPGTMDILLRELEATRPVFFVDNSLGTYRLFNKYPLHRFPRLARFVEANYVEVEAVRFRPHGFRVLILKDSARRTPLPLAGGTSTGQLSEPTVGGLPFTEPVPAEYDAQGAHSTGRLQRLELLVDGTLVDGVSFQPATSLSARFTVHFERLGRGRHRLVARATSASGEIRAGPEFVVECSSESVRPEQRVKFVLPVVTAGHTPIRISAPFGVGAQEEEGVMVFSAHAPSVISYSLPPVEGRLTGRFGFRPGAYAASNPGRTDGAEFFVNWITPAGQRTELFHRWLRPWEVPADRGEHSFDCPLPAGNQGGTLELAIGVGPYGNASSDWTYWSNLLLTTSREPRPISPP